MSGDTTEILAYLKLAHRSERAGVDHFKSAFDQAVSDSLRSLLIDLREVTQRQADAIDAQVIAYGGEVSGARVLFEQLLGKIGEPAQSVPFGVDPMPSLVARLIAEAHYEGALYQTIEAHAALAEDDELVALTQSLRREQTMIADRLAPYLVPPRPTVPVEAAPTDDSLPWNEPAIA
jgi:hypothetical protein